MSGQITATVTSPVTEVQSKFGYTQKRCDVNASGRDMTVYGGGNTPADQRVFAYMATLQQGQQVTVEWFYKRNGEIGGNIMPPPDFAATPVQPGNPFPAAPGMPPSGNPFPSPGAPPSQPAAPPAPTPSTNHYVANGPVFTYEPMDDVDRLGVLVQMQDWEWTFNQTLIAARRLAKAHAIDDAHAVQDLATTLFIQAMRHGQDVDASAIGLREPMDTVTLLNAIRRSAADKDGDSPMKIESNVQTSVLLGLNRLIDPVGVMDEKAIAPDRHKALAFITGGVESTKELTNGMGLAIRNWIGAQPPHWAPSPTTVLEFQQILEELKR